MLDLVTTAVYRTSAHRCFCIVRWVDHVLRVGLLFGALFQIFVILSVALPFKAPQVCQWVSGFLRMLLEINRQDSTAHSNVLYISCRRVQGQGREAHTMSKSNTHEKRKLIECYSITSKSDGMLKVVF